MVTRRRTVHAGSHGLDDAGALVPGNDREPVRAQVALGQMEVRVADPGRGHAHQHLLVARRVEVHLLDAGRGAGLTEDDRPHRPTR